MVLNAEEEFRPLASSKKHLSAKERTRARFDKIIKSALKEPKIKNKEQIQLQPLTKNEELSSTAAVQETELNNEIVSEELQGLVNPSFEKDTPQFSKSRTERKKRKKKTKIPIEPTVIIKSTAEITTEDEVRSAEDAERNLSVQEDEEIKSSPGWDSITSEKEILKSHRKVPESPRKVSDVESLKAKLSVRSKIKGEPKGQTVHLENIARKSRREKLAKAVACPPETLVKSEEVEESDSSTEEILAVKIHRVDRLELTPYINHPVVQIHIINTQTGNYVAKLHRTRPVTSFYESRNAKVDFVLPVMTRPFDFRQQSSVIPRWEETVLYNESFKYFVQSKPEVIIFFEVLDFISGHTLEHVGTTPQPKGWFHIAWAFLKLLGQNGAINANRKMQLQLYHPPRHKVLPEPGKATIFQWWANTTRVRYPGSLHVTVAPVTNINLSAVGPRAILPTQEEQGQVSLQDFYNGSTNGAMTSFRTMQPHVNKEFAIWDRLPGQNCKIPNKMVLNLPGGTNGCLVCAFSPDGKVLACGCCDDGANYISLFEIPSGKWVLCLQKHHGLIYDLNWSHDGKFLVSASADSSARVWGLERENETVVLPHPSFTYAASFHPQIPSLVVTGCYDGTVRVWIITVEERSAQLIQELDGHRGHVNSLCFHPQGLKLFTGDSVGVIRVWNCHVTAHPRRQGITEDWSLYSEINDKDLKGVAINHLCFHPNGRNLLMQSQNSQIHLMDVNKEIIFQRFSGILNVRERIRSCVSPCGSYIIGGSEDGTVTVHNVTSGDKIAGYANLPHEGTIHCTVFHPLDHIVAFCGLGDDEPIAIYKYDKQMPQLSVKQVLSTTVIPDNGTLENVPFRSTPIKGAIGGEETYEHRRSVTFDLSRKEPDSLLEKIKSRLAYVTDSYVSTKDLSRISRGAEEHLYDTVDTWKTWGSTFDTYEESAQEVAQ